MIFEANKEFMENLSLQRLSEMRLSTQRLARRSFAPFQTKSPKSPFFNMCEQKSYPVYGYSAGAKAFQCEHRLKLA